MRESLPGAGYESRSFEEIAYICIHHSAADRDSSALELANLHIYENGWPGGIGYHFLVHHDGSIDYVGDILTARANVWGRNREVIGICLPGDFTYKWPWPLQLNSAWRLVRYLRTLLPWAEVVGHRDIALSGHGTSCPGATYKNGWDKQLL